MRTTDGMKKRIAECFIKLVAKSPDPRERVSVTAIVRELGVDRKTFYNHFDNTTDLVIWIYRYDLADVLKERKFFIAELDYPVEGLCDKYSDLPCYARFIDGNGFLHQGTFFREQYLMLSRRDEYYRVLFAYPCYIDFYKYVISLTVPMFKKDALIMLGEGRSMPESALNFLAEYHAIGVWGRVLYYYSHRRQSVPEENLDSFWNYAHKTMKVTIDMLCADAPPYYFEDRLL